MIPDPIDSHAELKQQGMAELSGDALWKKMFESAQSNTQIANIKAELKNLKTARATDVGTKKPECFGHGTDVVMSDGTRVEIQFLEPGCTVLARCEETGELAACKVLKLFEHEKVETYRVVYIDDEGYKDGVYTTAQHPFWVKGKGWTPVCELESGQLLETHNGRVSTISEVKKTGYRETVYNLEVEGFHTYFVGTFGVWVHNKNNTETKIQNELPTSNDKAKIVDNGIIPDLTKPVTPKYTLKDQRSAKGEVHALDSIAKTDRRTEFLPNDEHNLLGSDGTSQCNGVRLD